MSDQRSMVFNSGKLWVAACMILTNSVCQVGHWNLVLLSPLQWDAWQGQSREGSYKSVLCLLLHSNIICRSSVLVVDQHTSLFTIIIRIVMLTTFSCVVFLLMSPCVAIIVWNRSLCGCTEANMQYGGRELLWLSTTGSQSPICSTVAAGPYLMDVD